MTFKSITDVITNSSSESYVVSYEDCGAQLRSSLRAILQLFGWAETDCELDKYVTLWEGYSDTPPRIKEWKEKNPTVERILNELISVLDSVDYYEA